MKICGPNSIQKASYQPRHGLAVARVARIVTEVTLGRGNINNLEELARTAKELEKIVPSLGAAVLSSLKKDPEEWAAHIEQNAAMPASVSFRAPLHVR